MRLLLVVLVLLLLVGGLLFFQPGGYLIVNEPQRSDAIVVLGGDQVDLRYARGLELLRAGYGNNLIVDVVPGEVYGRSTVDLAQDYVAKTAGANASQVSVCVIHGDSTKEEAPQAAACIERLQPAFHSGVLVSDDYHTRRALSIFRAIDPQYTWTAAASHNEFYFGLPWWKNREWAKTYLTEVQKLLYWELWDRWRK
ncbi:MAG: YdcF family protein [Candidatus Korobacteraceae bacterium]